jgi:tRNA1(Val) A37 N6-methylase TrmN6
MQDRIPATLEDLGKLFTYNYKQPDEYHFSLDSIYFAEYIAKQLEHRPHLQDVHLLDLCAGCGVIGFELSWFLQSLKKIDFIEIQDTYTSYFYENVAIINRPELELRWHLINYSQLLHPAWQNKYDLIVSNPPYFQAGHGLLSPSTFKNRCRFFLDSSFEIFLYGMVNALVSGGEAYFLQRSLQQHGNDLFFYTQTLLKDFPIRVKKMMTIGSADVIYLKKN